LSSKWITEDIGYLNAEDAEDNEESAADENDVSDRTQ